MAGIQDVPDDALREIAGQGDLSKFSDSDLQTIASGRPAPVAAEHFQRVAARPAQSFADYLESGWQGSTTGLYSRKALPEVETNADSPWYGRLAANAARLVGDAPTLVLGATGGRALGAAAGATGGPYGVAIGAELGTYGGAMALTEGVRQHLIDSYTRGDVASSDEFITRAMHDAWAAFKGGAVGALTRGVGLTGKGLLAEASPLMQATVPTAAELTTMTTAASALEGKLPEPQDFIDGAVMLGGLHAVGTVAPRLRNIFVKTGKTPEEVIADTSADRVEQRRALEDAMMRQAGPGEISGEQLRDLEKWLIDGPKLKADMLDPKKAADAIPDEYRPLAEEQQARNAVPDVQIAKNFLEKPFADVPQEKGMPAVAGHINYEYVNSPEDLQRALSRLAELNKDKVDEQRRGPDSVPWERTRSEAAAYYHQVYGREPDAGANAAQLSAFNQATVGLAGDLLREAERLRGLGRPLTKDEELDFATKAARASMVFANFRGAAAETGRALNVLKDMRAARTGVENVNDILSKYVGREGGVQDLVTALGEAKDPAQVVSMLREMTPWQKGWRTFMEYYRAGLLSGLNGFQARQFGSLVMSGLKVPELAIASKLGDIRGATENRVQPGEASARAAGLSSGALDVFSTVGAWLRDTAREPGQVGPRILSALEQAKQKANPDITRPAMIPGKAGTVIRAVGFGPDTLNEAATRTLNEHAVFNQLAVRQAMDEKIQPGTDEFNTRVAEIRQNPTDEMREAAQKAGKDAALMTPLGEKGRAFNRFIKDTPAELIFPFPTAMGNTFKWLATHIPGTNFLVKEWRDDYAAGGAKRDEALAKIAFGSMLAGGAFALARSGIITGSRGTSSEERGREPSGERPLSIKIGDKWYGYDRVPVIGGILGLVADGSKIYDKMGDSDEGKQSVLQAVATAFALNATSLPIMKGLSDVVDAVQHADRYGQHYLESLMANLVPLSQMSKQVAEANDDYARQVYSVWDAMQRNVPGARNKLEPARNVAGEPVPTPNRLWFGAPIQVSEETKDPVLRELARLKVSISDIPRSVEFNNGVKDKELGRHVYTPEERDRYAAQSGDTFMQVMKPVVESPGWADIPDAEKRLIFHNAVTAAHKVGAAVALTDETREAEIERIQAAMQRRLEATPTP